MADERDTAQKAQATPQADLELADKEAGEVKGGMAYRSEGKKGKKKKKGGPSGGGSATNKPM